MSIANTARFIIEVDGLSSKLQVAELQGREEISALFSYLVTVVSEDHDIEFADVIGRPTLLTLISPDEEVARYVHGVIAQIEQTGIGTRLATYRVRMVPQAWLMAQRFDCRIFQNKSVVDIITDVVKGAGIASDRMRFVMQGTYLPREYCVQYRESDFDFVSRLMEDEGIFYFFEHTDAGHTMIFSDQTGVHADMSGSAILPYHPPSTGVATGDGVYPFRYREAVRSGAVEFNDFNFRKPALDLTSTSKHSVNTELEVYDYPGRYDVSANGTQRAKVRLQGLQVARKVGEGGSDCMRMVAGCKFQLEDHPRDPFNQEYLITQVETWAKQPQVYEEAAGGQSPSYNNEFVCIPVAVPYRADRVTAKPVIHGVQTAVVVGPAGEEIYTDEFGRVKVQFRWDRLGKNDEKSSCWMRVAQVWAGASWGAMFIPRVGHEVIVDFEEGDPDRPIVTGRVYHGTNKPPYPLPDEKTKSTLRSRTSPSAETFNELLMEDAQGKTQVVLSNAYGHKIVQDEKTQALTVQTRDNNKICLDDKSKNILVTTTNGHSILLDDENKKIEIKTKDGQSFQLVDNDENSISMQTKNKRLFAMNDKDKKIELVSEDGHSVLVNDKDKIIVIQTADGSVIALDDKNGVAKLESGDGKLLFKFDIKGGKILVENSGGDIKFSAPSGKFVVDALDIELTGSKDVKIKGNMNLKCEAGVQATIKGTMVTSESSGPHTIKGMPVQIN